MAQSATKAAAAPKSAAAKAKKPNALRLAVIPGDGIGKEVVPEGIKVLEAVGRKFAIESAQGAIDVFDEILRVIDSLQLTANYSVATPSDWKQGEDVIITTAVKDEDIPAKFPKGHKRIKPYLRTTPQPDLK